MRQYTRDYRHGHSQTRQTYQRKSQMTEPEAEVPQTSSMWVWIVAILLSVALFAGFFVVQHFASHGVKSGLQEQVLVDPKAEKESGESLLDPSRSAPNKGVTDSTETGLVVESLPVTNAKTDANTLLKYTFYEGLAKTEVVVNVEPLSVKLKTPYYIQAGSFGSESMALKEQARLKKHGQDTTVSVLKSKGRVYYRLRVGPYDDRLKMNKKRNELRALGVDVLLIKVTPDKEVSK